jgi:GNAT superfamily N-acetyltransferase
VDARAFLSMQEAAERDEFFDSRTLVACEGDRVVGFISWNGDYITWMYVDPDCHRRGIARMMLREALERIGPGAWTITLEGNSAAVGAFSEAGLEVVLSGRSDCEGYPCGFLRLALPTSRMHDPQARR